MTDYRLSLALLAPEQSSDEHESQDQADPAEWGQLYQSYISLHPWLQQGPAGPGGLMAASWLGLPVSSTHIAVGGVFGVGFFREWHAERRARKINEGRPPAARIAKQERARRKLVRRSHFLTIIAAWVITVPAAALLSALCFVLLRQIGF